MAFVLAEVGPQLVLRAVHTLGALLLAHQVGPGRPVAHLCVGYSAAPALSVLGTSRDAWGNLHAHLFQILGDMSCSETLAR